MSEEIKAPLKGKKLIMELKKLPKPAKIPIKKKEEPVESDEEEQVESDEEKKTEWITRTIKGKRKLADGTVKEYTYQRRYPKKTVETRGAKPKPNKSKLRDLIKNLDSTDKLFGSCMLSK